MEILTRKSDPKYDEDLVNKRYIDRKLSEVNLDSVPVGLGGWYPSNTIPNGWLLCDGRAISRTTYSALFAILGTTHGSGDGSTTFNIPNIKGRTIVGRDSADTDFDVLGETRGSKYTETHTHNVVSNFAVADVTATLGVPNYVFNKNNTIYGTGSITTTPFGTGNAGNIQPSIVENYIIKAFVVSNTPLQDNQVTIFNDMINALNSKITVLEANMYNVGSGAPNNNLNDCQTNGLNFWTPTTANKPTAGSPAPDYGTIFTMVSSERSGTGSNWVNQLGFATGGTIFFRQKINNAAWTSWRLLH